MLPGARAVCSLPPPTSPSPPPPSPPPPSPPPPSVCSGPEFSPCTGQCGVCSSGECLCVGGACTCVVRGGGLGRVSGGSCQGQRPPRRSGRRNVSLAEKIRHHTPAPRHPDGARRQGGALLARAAGSCHTRSPPVSPGLPVWRPAGVWAHLLCIGPGLLRRVRPVHPQRQLQRAGALRGGQLQGATVLRLLPPRCAQLPAPLPRQGQAAAGSPLGPWGSAVHECAAAGLGVACSSAAHTRGVTTRSARPPTPYAACTQGRTCLTCGSSNIPGLVTCQGVRRAHRPVLGLPATQPCSPRALLCPRCLPLAPAHSLGAAPLVHSDSCRRVTFTQRPFPCRPAAPAGGGACRRRAAQAPRPRCWRPLTRHSRHSTASSPVQSWATSCTRPSGHSGASQRPQRSRSRAVSPAGGRSSRRAQRLRRPSPARLRLRRGPCLTAARSTWWQAPAPATARRPTVSPWVPPVAAAERPVGPAVGAHPALLSSHLPGCGACLLPGLHPPAAPLTVGSGQVKSSFVTN